MFLLTSNKNKLAEFSRFNLKNIEILPNIDIKEVSGSPVDVILYKALDAQIITNKNNIIVEDSILTVNNEEIVDIKYQLNKYLNLSSPNPASFTVSLGYNDGENIYIFQSKLNGIIQKLVDLPQDSFGFDAVFYPYEANGLSLYDLEKKGQKDDYSPRADVIKKFVNFLNNQPVEYLKFKINSISKWNGKYQI